MHVKRLLLILPLVLGGCKNSKENKIPLFTCESSLQTTDKGDKGFLLSVTTEELNIRKEKEASFPLFVYSQGCGTCDLFSYTRQGYLKETKTRIPFITLSNYLASHNAEKISDTSILFYSKGKRRATVSDLAGKYSAIDSFQKRRKKYTYPSASEIINPTVNRLGLTYSSDYPTFRFIYNNPDTTSLTKANLAGRNLCLSNTDALFSSLPKEDYTFYFRDKDSWEEKSQGLATALGFDSSKRRESDFLLLNISKEKTAIL